MKSVLDTSVLLGPMPDVIAGELAVSSTTLAEMHFGVLVARTDAVRAGRLRLLGELERKFEALPIDAAVARHYGQVAAAVAATGRQSRARVMDLLIAATAAAHGARLITRNASDLVGIEHLVEIVALT
jgi:toxin FitB